MLFPDCSPSFKQKYLSDSKNMFLNEDIFIPRWIKSLNASHIVMLDKFYQNPNIQGFLVKKNYSKVNKFHPN